MARALIVLLLGAVAGCFHATPWSPAAAQQQLRSLRDEAQARAPQAAMPASGHGLTADETYALARAHSPEVLALTALTDTAMAEVHAARQLENPQLRLTSFNVDDAISSQPALNIGLRVPIPRPGTVRAQAAGAEVAVEGPRGLAEDAERLLRSRVDLLFARLAALTADLEHAARASELRAERREQLSARAELAVATRVDVAMAEVERAGAGQELARVRDAIAEVEEQLARLAGLRGPVRFEAGPEQLHVVEADHDRDALTERALASRPELRTAHARVVEAEAAAHVARSEAWPWFDWAQLQYRAAPDSSPSAFGLAVALTLPVLSWNRGEIKASKALVRQRRAEQHARIVTVADEVDAAVAKVERTATRVLELERELLPAVEAARREAQTALATGALDPIVANDIELEAVEARRAHLAALLEHREAVIGLESVVGGPLAPPAAGGGRR